MFSKIMVAINVHTVINVLNSGINAKDTNSVTQPKEFLFAIFKVVAKVSPKNTILNATLIYTLRSVISFVTIRIVAKHFIPNGGYRLTRRSIQNRKIWYVMPAAIPVAKMKL